MNPVERELHDLDVVFKALASAPRRQIVLVLRFRGGSMTAGEIQERFGCTWATTSRHLKVLREAGVVAVEKVGRQRRYTLQEARVLDVLDPWLAWLR